MKLKCCFTSTETVGLLGTVAQDVHLDFHTVPELCTRMMMMMWSLMSSDVGLTHLIPEGFVKACPVGLTGIPDS